MPCVWQAQLQPRICPCLWHLQGSRPAPHTHRNPTSVACCNSMFELHNMHHVWLASLGVHPVSVEPHSRGLVASHHAACGPHTSTGRRRMLSLLCMFPELSLSCIAWWNCGWEEQRCERSRTLPFATEPHPSLPAQLIIVVALLSAKSNSGAVTCGCG